MKQPITIKRLELLKKLATTGIIKLFTGEKWAEMPDELIEKYLRTSNSRRKIDQ